MESVKDPVSITQPNESYTVKELVEKYVTGQPIHAVVKQPQWIDNSNFDSPDLEELSRMELVDKQELAQELAEKNRLAKEAFLRKRSEAEAEARSKNEAKRKSDEARSNEERYRKADEHDLGSDSSPASPAQRRLHTRRSGPDPESTTLT